VQKKLVITDFQDVKNKIFEDFEVCTKKLQWTF